MWVRGMESNANPIDGSPISKMYAVNQHDTGHFGIHGSVDARTVGVSAPRARSTIVKKLW